MKCSLCGSLALNKNFLQAFRKAVCDSCLRLEEERKQVYEKKEGINHESDIVSLFPFALITKTEARTTFLLTEEELADTFRLPFITRPNPFDKRWSEMKLYLLADVQKFAMEKWGSAEALEKQRVKRKEQRVEKRDQRFRETVKNLRKRTRLRETGLNEDDKLGTKKQSSFDYEEL